jgi:hypothetical protein
VIVTPELWSSMESTGADRIYSKITF